MSHFQLSWARDSASQGMINQRILMSLLRAVLALSVCITHIFWFLRAEFMVLLIFAENIIDIFLGGVIVFDFSDALVEYTTDPSIYLYFVRETGVSQSQVQMHFFQGRS
jgi:hypothetical protein